jgi:branched-subunit amino acid aminotransferase/4-amino-4-deoxychorismate lyase
VEERSVPVEELKEAEEVFCTGTAAGVASVGSITFKNTRSLLPLWIHVYICLEFYIYLLINNLQD